jgi:hypothetical protein
MLQQHYRNDLVLQSTTLSQRLIHIWWTMISSGISDPAKIVEVERFRLDSKFLQYDDVQRWSWSLLLLSPSWSRTRGRGEIERGGGAWGGDKSSWLLAIVCSPPPLGPLYIRGRRQHCPSTKAPKGWPRWGQGGRRLALGHPHQPSNPRAPPPGLIQ